MKGGVSTRNRIQEDEMRKKMLEENWRKDFEQKMETEKREKGNSISVHRRFAHDPLRFGQNSVCG